jgi:hypothetical protein
MGFVPQLVEFNVKFSFFLKFYLIHEKMVEICPIIMDILNLFFYVVMFHEPQTWGLMAIKNYKLHILYNINFIQFSSSNYWIKINFDSKCTLSFKCCVNF